MLINVAAGSAKEGEVEIGLLRDAAFASFHASDEMQCRGYSPRSSLGAADRALGHDFKSRMIAAADKMKAIWGEERINEATKLLAIGYRITPEYCREAVGLVDRARRALKDLENKLGAS